MRGLMQDFPLTVPMIFRRFMRLWADKSVVTGGPGGPRRHTWGQVGERTLRLCNALRRLGVEPGDRVATFAWNTHRHLEAYFAVPCMGAVLHTLNIRLFAEQIAYVANHAGDVVVLVDASLSRLLAPIRDQLRTVRHFVVLEDGDPDPAFASDPRYEELIGAEAATFDFPDLDERAAAAMCYTSGTTGNPKGVVYEHRSTVLHTMAVMMADTLGVGERDTVLPVVPMFHANCWGLPYAAAFAGANLVLPGSDLSPSHIASLITSERVTLAAGVPTIWVGVEPLLDDPSYDFSSLRGVVSGGSAVPEGLIRRYAARGLRIIHAWGMTETSPLGSAYRLRSDLEGASEEERFRLNAGQGIPVPGVEVRLCDFEGRELPWDGRTPGELEVRGPWIAAAYYDPDDDSNSAKFHDGWLRTGDVATIDPRGYIRITDRAKDLIKSGGEWISSVDLETKLMAHPDVLEAAVVGVPHPRWDERPLALVVRRPGATVGAEELIDFLRPQVARWWLPDAIEFVDEIPKTSVGKFDKKVIREKYRSYRLSSTS